MNSLLLLPFFSLLFFLSLFFHLSPIIQRFLNSFKNLYKKLSKLITLLLLFLQKVVSSLLVGLLQPFDLFLILFKLTIQQRSQRLQKFSNFVMLIIFDLRLNSITDIFVILSDFFDLIFQLFHRYFSNILTQLDLFIHSSKLISFIFFDLLNNEQH